MARRPRRVERFLETSKVLVAFVAAVRLYDLWDSPEGPAVVRDVHCLPHGRYRVIYRLVAAWGKEAW